MRRILTGGACALSMLWAGAAAEDSTEPSRFSLDNGMEVVVIPDHRAPVVTHMVWYKAGAVDEAEGKSGIAHLFEHVMFQETDDLEDGEFDKIVSRNGGQLNAFTSWDYTAYYERVAKEHLGLMMSLEAERMTDLVINEDPEGPFISERDVVKEERRQRIENNPSALLQEKMLTTLWTGHPYEITVIGHMSEVAALTPQDGIDFYEAYYSPENAILVVAGDVSAGEVKALAEEHYGIIEPTGLVDGTRTWQPVAPLRKTTKIKHSDPKVRQASWSRYYLGTSETRDRKKALALDVGLEVLGGGMTSRLYQALVERDKKAISVSTYAWTTLHDEGPAILSGTPVDGISLDEFDDIVMAEVRTILADGFTEAEVERARNSLAASAIYARDSQSAMANTFGQTLALGGSIDDVLSYSDDMKSVTMEEALAAVRSVFSPELNYIEGHLLPEETGQ